MSQLGLPQHTEAKGLGDVFFSFEDNYPDSCNMMSKL